MVLTQNWHIQWGMPFIASTVYLGIGCSLLAMLLWNKGLQKTSANLSGFFLALDPAFGILLAVILLNESITIISAMGMLVVICSAFLAVLLMWWQSQKKWAKTLSA